MHTTRFAAPVISLVMLCVATGVVEAQKSQSAPLRSVPAARANAARVPLMLQEGYVPFAIAIPDSFPYIGADAVILRNGSEIPDVILVRRNAMSAALLGDAARQLTALRAVPESVVDAGEIIRVQRGAKPWPRPRELERWVSLLAANPREQLQGLGEMVHIVLHMPVQSARRSLK